MIVENWLKFVQGIFQIEGCGTGYWIISSMQVPLAVFFTWWVLSNASTLQVFQPTFALPPIYIPSLSYAHATYI